MGQITPEPRRKLLFAPLVGKKTSLVDDNFPHISQSRHTTKYAKKITRDSVHIIQITTNFELQFAALVAIACRHRTLRVHVYHSFTLIDCWCTQAPLPKLAKNTKFTKTTNTLHKNYLTKNNVKTEYEATSKKTQTTTISTKIKIYSSGC